MMPAAFCSVISVRQFHEPPEVVQHVLAARRIDGGYDLVALASARTISASLVAILITSSRTVLVIRRARPKLHPTLTPQLPPPL